LMQQRHLAETLQEFLGRVPGQLDNVHIS